MSRYDSHPPVFFDSGVIYDDAGPAPLPKTRMAKIRRDWSRLNRAERVTFAQTVSTALTGNVPFAALNPTTAQLDALRTASASAEQAIKDADVNMGILRMTATTANDALMAGIERVALSAEGIGHGAEALLSTTGFNLVTATGPGPSVDMTQVINFSLTAGDFDGQVDGHCDPVTAARGYNVQICYDTAGPAWLDQADTPNTQFSIKNLTSGRRVWGRMRAFGTKGPGPWSDPATKIVP